jgi:DUF218 domain
MTFAQLNLSPSDTGRRTNSSLRSTRKLRHVAFILAVLIVFTALAWIERAPLLRGAAQLWILSDPLSSADAAVVLGGGLDTRPFAAAELYQRNLVKKILVSQVSDDRVVAIGVMPGHTDANRQVLMKLGVPASAIETFGTANKSTKDEMTALHAWVELNHASGVIIPVEIFASRRVRWTSDKEFSDRPIKIAVESFDPPDYGRANWWQHESGIVTFQNEILKYIYYRLKY